MKPFTFRVFIGYDPKEPAAFAVAAHSLLRHASKPITIVPLVQSQLRSIGAYTRERGATESTEFSLTRFLVPFLSHYEGISLFVDCDVLFQADVFELPVYPLAYPDQALFVCQHDYTPTDRVKFLGQVQTAYPRKNWSSVMLFDNAKCAALTPAYVNAATGLELHRFNWLADDQIGSLPLEWNWLSGEYPKNAAAKLIHYTLGGPWFDGYRSCDHADLWFAAQREMLGMAVQFPRFQDGAR